MPQAKKLVLPDGFSAAEVHSHTLASDGMVTAAELVEAAAKIGLSVICITDHDVIGNTSAAVERGQELGVDVVVGEEITTAMRPHKLEPGIHIVGLFLQQPIRMGMSLEDTVDAIHDQGGLAVIAHPFMRLYFASIWSTRLEQLLAERKCDGIELRHTAPVRSKTWEKLDNFYAKHSERLGAALGAGDSHYGANDLGRVVTIFPGSGAEDLRKAIEERTTSPYRGFKPQPPSMNQRLSQQYRSLWWLNLQRRRGLVGHGAGPKHS